MPLALAYLRVIFLAMPAILILIVLMNSIAIWLRNRYEQKW